MRALCGAIMTAGALIGLGLTALGLGTRYQDVLARGANDRLVYVRFGDLDTAMMVVLVALLIALLVGMGTAFLGLAYHHERRLREHEHRIHSTGRSVVES